MITVENNKYVISSKISLELLYEPEFPLLGIYAKDLKADTQNHLYIHIQSREVKKASQLTIDSLTDK